MYNLNKNISHSVDADLARLLFRLKLYVACITALMWSLFSDMSGDRMLEWPVFVMRFSSCSNSSINVCVELTQLTLVIDGSLYASSCDTNWLAKSLITQRINADRSVTSTSCFTQPRNIAADWLSYWRRHWHVNLCHLISRRFKLLTHNRFVVHKQLLSTSALCKSCKYHACRQM